MKLFYGTTSPYVRKVLVAAIECGLDDKIEREEVLPWEPDTQYGDLNPLGKIPALFTDDGQLLYDSRVIVEHLDHLSDSVSLLPHDHRQRMECLRMASLGDGMMEAMILLFSELVRRPEELRWTYWDERMREKVDRALDALEADSKTFDADQPDLAQITAACALGWLEFRCDILNIDFREGRPGLSTWFDAVSRRQSMATTLPVVH